MYICENWIVLMNFKMIFFEDKLFFFPIRDLMQAKLAPNIKEI